MSLRRLHWILWAGTVAAVFASREFYVQVVGPARYADFAADVPGVGWWVAWAGLLIAASHSVGLPEMPESRLATIGRSFAAIIASLSVVSMAQLALADVLLPRSSIALFIGVFPLWALISWNLSTDSRKWSAARESVLLVSGQPDDVAALIRDLDDRAEITASIAGVMAVGEARETDTGGCPLVEVATRVQPTVLVLDRTAQDAPSIVAQATTLHSSGMRIRTLALFYEGWLGKLPISELAQVSMLFDIGELHRMRYVRIKRLFDIAIGLVGSVIFALVIPAIVVGNLVANRGPLFFRQVRVGKNGETFRLAKFRTMTPGTDNSSWTCPDDERITAFGDFLRRTHIDELPQMWSVVRGELSIVGPRPEQPQYVDELRSKIPFYDARHLVRPGLTGWAQVKLGYANTDGDALEKLQYDFYYLRRQGFGFDVRIVGRTFREVVGGLGR
jgi:lipopolysaccharide/colanic/teichoic acid biosynthesis glycosyltransferase